jgi:glycosyltransferase involved in cell wall biosynthesis
LNKKEIINNSKKNINFSFFKKDTINFINIGRLVDQKDHITILKSFQKLKKKTNYKFRLLIIGDGVNRNSLKEYIKKNKLNSHIKIIKFQKNPYPYLKESEVFILSSLFEGLPNVLLESLSLKKFIISSNCPTGPKEILDHGKNGLLFKMGEENDLYKKIIYYLQNKKKCKKLIFNGFNRLWRFDYHLNLEKYVKLISS